MLLTKNNLNEVLHEIVKAKYWSLDTETTGLRCYQGHKPFLASLAYRGTSGAVRSFALRLPEDFYMLQAILVVAPLKTYFHNTKFDLHMLLRYFDLPLLLTKELVDCQVLARLEYNDRINLKMESLAKLVGKEKIDEVKKYCDKNKLYDIVQIPGKKKREKDYHYEQVPMDIIVPYACEDAVITLLLGEFFERRVQELDEEAVNPEKTLQNVLDVENKLTKILYKMERRGILIDIDYTKKAAEYEKQNIKLLERKFFELAGFDYEETDACFKRVFELSNTPFKYTEKGNLCFDKEAVKTIKGELGKLVLGIRSSSKRYGTYFANYLFMSDSDGVLHGNFKQAGTGSGRMSASDPNLQNVPKRGEDKSEYPVRRCFIPRPGYILMMFDYDQMEYRLLMDKAGEIDLINEVLGGLDVHEATAKMLNITRDQAKTINFALLYGTGNDHLAEMLKIPVSMAKSYRNIYFSRLVHVKRIIKEITQTAERRGYIFNHCGRRSYFPRHKDFAYAAPNYYIQGGCADVMKLAMVNIDGKITHLDAHMLLQVHDELIFEVRPEDANELAKIVTSELQGAYQHNYLPLTAGSDYSEISWFDKKEFIIKE